MNTISPVEKLASNRITDQDVSLATRLVDHTPAFIGGSYLTNPDTANDIDVVIGETEYWEHQSHFIGFRENTQSDEYTGIHELAWTANYRSVNLLVVKDMFLDAYAQAAEYMERSPYMYQTRKERIRLHQVLKNMIRQRNDIPQVVID